MASTVLCGMPPRAMGPRGKGQTARTTSAGGGGGEASFLREPLLRGGVQPALGAWAHPDTFHPALWVRASDPGSSVFSPEHGLQQGGDGGHSTLQASSLVTQQRRDTRQDGP